MLVPREYIGQAERIAAAAAQNWTVGNPFAPDTQLGPLVSAAQRDVVREYIEIGVADGAKLIVGGSEPPDGLDRGYFIRPTIFSNVANSMRIAVDEIFGPVLAMIPYDGESHAIEIANDTPYGLSGGVWSGSDERAVDVARRLRTGQVSINGGPFNLMAPFGGYKQSGHGRELGRFGLEEFLQVKAMQFK
jgi:acyl-CoA reductase-like NAD-dependent aldehyde dehydrogenase